MSMCVCVCVCVCGIHSYPTVQKSITGVAFSPDTNIAYTVSLDGTLRVWDIKVGSGRRRRRGGGLVLQALLCVSRPAKLGGDALPSLSCT